DGSQRLRSVRRLGCGLNDGLAINALRIFKEAEPLSLITPIALRPGGVQRATIVSACMSTRISRNAIENLGASLAAGGLQGDSQAPRIAFADRLSYEILFLGQRQMYDPPFTGIHGTEYECRRGCPNLARGVLGHRAGFTFPRGAVVIGVADDQTGGAQVGNPVPSLSRM